jgi:hypothetical protein
MNKPTLEKGRDGATARGEILRFAQNHSGRKAKDGAACTRSVRYNLGYEVSENEQTCGSKLAASALR